MKTHVFPFMAAYADTDAGGIVYHGRYIEIAERARMAWLRGVAAEGSDVGFVVKDITVKYMHPLKVGAEFVVESQILKIGAVSINIEQKFVKDGVICAIINLVAVYVGADLRIKRIPDAILAMAE